MNELQHVAEHLECQRLRLLSLNLIGFIIWDGLRVIQTYLEVDKGSIITPVLLAGSLLGGVLWIWSLVKMLKNGKALKNKKLLDQILGDELFELNRSKAFRTALLAVTITQLLFVLITAVGIDISGGLIAELNILIVVTAFLASFIFHQGKE